MLASYFWCQPIVVGKAKQRGFHAKRQQYQDQCHIGIYIGAHTIIARSLRHIVRIKWHQQIIQESANDTRQPVNGRILHQTF